MSDLTNDQKYYVYLIFSICFLLFLIFAIRSTILIIKRKEWKNHKFSIHICVLIATCVCISDDVSRVVLAQQPLAVLYGLCYFPYVMTWYFIFTAYLFALERWISIYQAVSTSAGRYAFKLRVSFIVCDAILFVLLISSGSLYCHEIGLYAGNNQGHIIYIICLVITAFVISTLFAFYGVRIARKLKEGMKIRDATSTDKHVYMVTQRIAIISSSMSLGAFLAIIFSALEDKNLFFGTLARIIQMFFEILVMLEILFVAKPKSEKQENTETTRRNSLGNTSTTPTSHLSGSTLTDSPSQASIDVKTESV